MVPSGIFVIGPFLIKEIMVTLPCPYVSHNGGFVQQKMPFQPMSIAIPVVTSTSGDRFKHGGEAGLAVSLCGTM
jgi:hypothetical protein